MPHKILIAKFIFLISAVCCAGQNANVAVSNKAAEYVAPPSRSIVRGRVFYENTGRPVRRAAVMLIAQDGRGQDGRSIEAHGLTDNNGYFQINELKAGTYYAFVNAPGVISPLAFIDIGRPRSEGLGDAVRDFTPIVVDGISSLDVEIPARLGGAIGGRVFYANGDPAIGVKVEILREDEGRFVPVIPNFSAVFSLYGQGGGGFQTDDRGVYRFSGLPAGEYIVKVSESAAHSNDNGRDRYNPFGDILFGGFSLLTIYYPDAFSADRAEKIKVMPGQEHYEVNLTIPDRDLFRAEGKIIAAATKAPIENARVTIKRIGDNTGSIFDRPNRHDLSTDEQGNWSFKELPKGSYQLSIAAAEMVPRSGADMPVNAVMMNMAHQTKSAVRRYARKVYEIIVDDKDLSGIVIELGFGAKISGTVTIENSRAMPSSVTIYTNTEKGDNPLMETVRNEQNDSPGAQKPNRNFEMEGVPAEKIYFNVLLGNDDFYVKSATAGQRDLFAAPLELGEGEALHNVKVVLGADVGTIKGRILRAGGEPVPGAELALVPTDPVKRRNSSFYRYVTADENGEFIVKAAPWEYAVVSFDKEAADGSAADFHKWLDAAIGDAQRVSVRAGETTAVRFSLP